MGLVNNSNLDAVGCGQIVVGIIGGSRRKRVIVMNSAPTIHTGDGKRAYAGCNAVRIVGPANNLPGGIERKG